MTRLGLGLLLVTLATLAAGCAVGRFVVGAPSTGTTGVQSALLLQRCTGCHEVPQPESMTSTEWLASLERMQKRMVLPASEWDSLAAMVPRR